eukprot:TRINITY_DN4098_c1_g1_i4.p1 TRINITY_DN4098_c1_g1~~TRINITY_DN4098_c1_g1_i4.p1  ORF type:complete len:652 (-),score=236.82 TRINITY_DN4098_c1_g1_i4:52-2007(-)
MVVDNKPEDEQEKRMIQLSKEQKEKEEEEEREFQLALKLSEESQKEEEMKERRMNMEFMLKEEREMQKKKEDEERIRLQLLLDMELEERQRREEEERRNAQFAMEIEREQREQRERVQKMEEEERKSLEYAMELAKREEEEVLNAKKRQEEEHERLFRKMIEEEEQKRAVEMTSGVHSCPNCRVELPLDGMFYLEKCTHMFCKSCLRDEILSKIDELKCSEIRCLNGKCCVSIDLRDIKELLSQEEREAFEAASTDEMIESNPHMFVRCPNPDCVYVMEKLRNTDMSPQPMEKVNGKEMSEEAVKHRNDNRFRCRECSTEFCAECKGIPYHDGFTCQQFVKYEKAVHCRYCAVELSAANAHSLPLKICNSQDCVAKSKLGCEKTLACRHLCGGIKNERNCLPCLNEDCNKEEEGQKSDSYCNICWVEDLGSAPCIQLECGHIFHSNCVQQKVSKGWSGARITFGFLDCPLCKKRMKHPSLEASSKPMTDLLQTIIEKAMARLKLQGESERDEFKDPNSQFYQNPEKYALYKYSYFPCFSCKKPYFGGERACEAEREFNMKDLICPNCCGDGKDNCKRHGTEYIEYKCKYCCKTAVWFCWGNTHFCEPCHNKAGTLPNVPKDQLPKCDCNRQHPPNGEEHCLGCSMCFADNF